MPAPVLLEKRPESRYAGGIPHVTAVKPHRSAPAPSTNPMELINAAQGRPIADKTMAKITDMTTAGTYRDDSWVLQRPDEQELDINPKYSKIVS